jgi:cysteinyl-tRNA synthetase
VDLLFPHHENEIAQSECCNSSPGHHVPFAKHWYHSEHLLVDGKKMSKSLGNLYTLDDLKAKGFSPAALRYALLSGHPRKQLNFTLDSLHAAESALGTLRKYYSAIKQRAGTANPASDSSMFALVYLSLLSDLNSPAALGELFAEIKEWTPEKVFPEQAALIVQRLDKILFALGLDLTEPVAPKTEIPADIAALAEKRWAAKQSKDFAAADTLRKDLTAAGWNMLDRKDGYSLEPVKKV